MTRSEASSDPSRDASTDLTAEILRIVAIGKSDPEAMRRELAAQQRGQGDRVYAQFLFLLAHLDYAPAVARDHVERIVELQTAMARSLAAPVDVRVALVSYFLDVSRALKNPKVIEIDLFQETQESAYRDALTGLYNYRYFRDHLRREVRRAERYGQPLALLMIDVDDFKGFNDRHGHPEGSRALATLAGLITATLRDSDVCVRYGGEEFALILPSTPRGGALLVGERLRSRVEAARFGPEPGSPAHLTVSAGLATVPDDAGDADELVRQADQALYRAKSAGKNRICAAGREDIVPSA